MPAGLFLGHRYCTTVRSWMIYEILGWGVFSAGSFPVMDARWSDTFGRTPELSARLQAKIWTYATCFQVVSPIIGAQIFARNQLFGFWASAISLALQSVIILSSHETLAPKDRKPFSLQSSNPFSNIALLFTNGPGLRRLAFAVRPFAPSPPSDTFAFLDSFTAC